MVSRRDFLKAGGALARLAWDTAVATVRMKALDFVHSNSRAICETGIQAEAAVVALLDMSDVSDNIMLSRSGWRLAFDGFETDISVNTALDEFHRVLAMADAEDGPLYQIERETSPSATYNEFVRVGLPPRWEDLRGCLSGHLL